MAVVYKCKACGGSIDIMENGLGKCRYCDSIQTLPKDRDDQIKNLLNRANDYRLGCDFDRAIYEYERILELDESEPEAHWGLFLSRYGVEYVKDPITFIYKPTLRRISSISVYDDIDYQASIKYAPIISIDKYKRDADEIETVMKELLLISAQQEPYDIFLCYKEADDVTHCRTDDSYLAHELYNELTANGYNVFFAPKSLDAGLYEPKIYAAIISAKVMLVLGTKKEYFSAVWVKNEWSRFNELINHGEEKKLIPIYKNMEASDLPNALAKYQALNMSGISFLSTLLTMISEIVSDGRKRIKFDKEVAAEEIYIERGFLALEDKSFADAKRFFESALNLNPHNAKAYLGNMMVEMKISTPKQIITSSKYLNSYKDFDKALRFADPQLKTTLIQYEKMVKETLDTQEYNRQISKIKQINEDEDLIPIIENLKQIEYFRNTKQLIVFLSRVLGELKNNMQLRNDLKTQIEEKRRKIGELSESLRFKFDDFFVFRSIGVIVGIILAIMGFKMLWDEYAFLKLVFGLIGGFIFGGLFGGAAYCIGFVLDKTLLRLIFYALHKVKSKSKKELMERLELEIQQGRTKISVLEQEYNTKLERIRSLVK